MVCVSILPRSDQPACVEGGNTGAGRHLCAGAAQALVQSLQSGSYVALSSTPPFHEKMRFVQKTEPFTQLRSFRRRRTEVPCLRWLALEKTVKDTADLGQVKYNTVRIALAEAEQYPARCSVDSTRINLIKAGSYLRGAAQNVQKC